MANAVRQRIQLGFGVVQRQRRSCGRGHAESIHHGLSTVVAGPDGDSIAIEHRTDIMRMDTLEHKREHAHLLARSSDQSQAWNRTEQLCAITKQFLFVRCGAIDAYSRDVLQRGAEPNDSGDMRRTCLELVRQFVVDRLLESDGADHVAASLVRRHLLQQLLTSVQNTDARRAEYLMA